jgi:hypothetical protein
MRWNLDWSPHYQIRERKLPYRDSLKAYANIGRERFQSDRFEEFCAIKLAELDEVAWINYVGHGGLDRLADEALLQTKTVAQLGNGEWLFVLTGFSCSINRF